MVTCELIHKYHQYSYDSDSERVRFQPCSTRFGVMKCSTITTNSHIRLPTPVREVLVNLDWDKMGTVVSLHNQRCRRNIEAPRFTLKFAWDLFRHLVHRRPAQLIRFECATSHSAVDLNMNG